VFFSLIGAYYYLRVVKVMYFDQGFFADRGARRYQGADVGEWSGRGIAWHLPE
jgi:NADH:ubiquinone oxidoreductase subunit 2 (subunit N)